VNISLHQQLNYAELSDACRDVFHDFISCVDIVLTFCRLENSEGRNHKGLSTGGGPGSLVGITTAGWTVGGSNPVGGENFRTRPDQLCGPPSLLYNGYRVFPGGKSAGAWC
jgi:hypothetical protein